MIFKCKNCGGNSVYSPDKGRMVCPHCESEESQEKIAGVGVAQCGNCGAPLEVSEHTSATKCPNCGSYHVFEERITGEYTPHLVLPFKISKQEAIEAIRKEFKKRMFTPKEYLSNASIEKMEGTYVPFFMYGFHSDVRYQATGTKVRTWTSGDYRYKETSYFHVARDMDIDFDKIPVDASLNMDNSVMDLVEPYHYSALVDFEDKYMSGFLGEKYSDDPAVLKERAESKARQDSRSLLQDTLLGYSSLTSVNQDIDLTQRACEYALLPVWVYEFKYQGKTYTYHVNGQTGKVIGKTPIAYPKVFAYSAGIFAICMASCLLAFGLTNSQSVEALSTVRGNTESTEVEQVYDYGDVLTDEEEESLRQLIDEKEVETRSDIAVVTLNESLVEYAAKYEDIIGPVPTEKCVMVYADNFADEHKMGYDKPYGDSMVFLDNWYREADGGVYSWMSTSGRIEDYFTISSLEDIMSYSLAVVDDDPYTAYKRIVNEYADYYVGTDSEEPVMLYALIGSFVIAGIFCLINCIGKKGKKTVTDTTYVVGGRPHIRLQEDRFIRKSVSKTKISSDSGSGGGGSGHHRSAGGRSHGGGGHRR